MSRSVSASGGGAGAVGSRARLLGGRVATALHVEVDADLEEAQRRHRPDRLHLGQLAEQLDRAVEAELRVRRHAQREPDVELVLALVVVGHAGMRVEHRGGRVGPLGRGARGHQHDAVAQPAGVEDRRDLADDSLAAQPRDPLEHLVLGHLQLLAQRRVGPLDERELVLDQVTQALVGASITVEGYARAMRPPRSRSSARRAGRRRGGCGQQPPHHERSTCSSSSCARCHGIAPGPPAGRRRPQPARRHPTVEARCAGP